MVALSCCPFGVYQKTKAVLKGEVPNDGVIQLLLKLPGHGAKPHVLQLGDGFVCQHYLSLLW